jgi:hypothetical protein
MQLTIEHCKKSLARRRVALFGRLHELIEP